jgi:hypothetical protein
VTKNHAFHHQIEMMMYIKQSVMRLNTADQTFALRCAVTKPFAIQLEKQQDVIVSYCQIENISYTHELDVLVWDDYVDIVRIMQHTIGLAQIQQICAIDPSIPSADQLQSQEKIVGAIAYKTQLMQALRNTLVRSRAIATRENIAQQEQKITYLKMEIDALQTELSKMRYLG